MQNPRTSVRSFTLSLGVSERRTTWPKPSSPVLKPVMGRPGRNGGSQRMWQPMASSKGRSPVSNFTRSITRRFAISSGVPCVTATPAARSAGLARAAAAAGGPRGPARAGGGRGGVRLRVGGFGRDLQADVPDVVVAGRVQRKPVVVLVHPQKDRAVGLALDHLPPEDL